MLLRTLTAACFLMLPGFAAENFGLIQVTDVRTWTHPGSTRVVVQFSGPFEYAADSTANPDRIFFDIAGARPWIGKRRMAVRRPADALVQSVRVAERLPGTTRVVFDLNSPVAYTVSRLSAPDRMVIEFRRKRAVRAILTRRHKVFVPPPTPQRIPRPVVLAGIRSAREGRRVTVAEVMEAA